MSIIAHTSTQSDHAPNGATAVILPVRLPAGGANDSEYLKNRSWIVCGANHYTTPCQSAHCPCIYTAQPKRTMFDSC